MQFASGQLGEELVQDHVRGLRNFTQLGVSEVADDYFRLTLMSMADHWRRLIFPTCSFPWILFRVLIAGSDPVHELEQWKETKHRCHQCVDSEFSGILLDFIPVLGIPTSPSEKLQRVIRFLEDLACYAPISSDLVECLHGFSQQLLHRWRGCKPSDSGAQQMSMWASVVKSFAKLRSFVWRRHMDANFSHRVHRFGNKGVNQYTKHVGKDIVNKSNQWEPRNKMSLERMDRLIAFGQETSMRGPRKLCGNMFATM